MSDQRRPSLRAALSARSASFFHSRKGSSSAGVSGTTTPSSIFTSSRMPAFLRRARPVTMPSSPFLHALLKRTSEPNLQAVNTALEELRLVPDEDEGKAPWLEKLAGVANLLDRESRQSKLLYRQAMSALESKRTEVLRALCWEITNMKHADPETKAYAYNLLSTMNGPELAVKYLEQSAKLIGPRVEEILEGERLLGIVNEMKERALRDAAWERERPTYSNGGEEDTDEDEYEDEDQGDGGGEENVAQGREGGIDDTALESQRQRRREDRETRKRRQRKHLRSLPRLGSLRPWNIVDEIKAHLHEKAVERARLEEEMTPRCVACGRPSSPKHK